MPGFNYMGFGGSVGNGVSQPNPRAQQQPGQPTPSWWNNYPEWKPAGELFQQGPIQPNAELKAQMNTAQDARASQFSQASSQQQGQAQLNQLNQSALQSAQAAGLHGIGNPWAAQQQQQVQDWQQQQQQGQLNVPWRIGPEQPYMQYNDAGYGRGFGGMFGGFGGFNPFGGYGQGYGQGYGGFGFAQQSPQGYGGYGGYGGGFGGFNPGIMAGLMGQFGSPMRYGGYY